MKTQIITLESHDDLISVRDRMSWAKTPRILLVWPKFEKVSLRHVDLKILQRHATALGAQLGLVTRTRRVRVEAEGLGIPVFESATEAQKVGWPKPRRRRWPHKAPNKTLREQREQVSVKEGAWRAHPVTRITALAIGVLSVLAVVSLFIPRAQIILKPVVKTQTITMAVSASPNVSDVFITGSLPSHEKRMVVEGTQTILVTSQGVVAEAKAKGVVEFSNLTQQEQTIPQGAVVSADGVRFATIQDITLAAGIGRKTSVRIEAVEGGTSSNVDAGVIKAIEGQLGLKLTVTNPDPTSGGRESLSVQASDADRKGVKELLLRSLTATARAKLQAELKPGDILFDKTLAVTQTLSEKYDPPAGGVGLKLTLTLQLEFSAQYAAASDLTKLATLTMNAGLPSGFHELIPADTVTVESLSNPVVGNDGSVRWNIRAQRQIEQGFDANALTQLIQGTKVNQARKSLAAVLPKDSKPTLQLSPAWWPYVPMLPIRIEVVTK
jgi:hypothetical protein